MDRRSTSAEYTHFGGDVTAQVNSSHGVRLSGGSTGGIVAAVGDDTNVTLTLRGQGTGQVVIGSPLASTGIISTHINLQSSRTQIGSSAAGVSTSYLLRVWRERIDFTIPAMPIAGGAEDGNILITGLTTNAVVAISPRGPLNSSVSGINITA